MFPDDQPVAGILALYTYRHHERFRSTPRPDLKQALLEFAPDHRGALPYFRFVTSAELGEMLGEQ